MTKKLKLNRNFWSIVLIFFLVLSFAAWGVADYVRGNDSSVVIAKVGEVEIPAAFFESQLERFRAFAKQERPNTTDEEINNPRTINEQFVKIIRDQLLTQYINKYHLYPSVDRVAQAIANQPDFAENGVFSPDKYLQTLKQNGYKPRQFEDNVRNTISRDVFIPRFTQAQLNTPSNSSVFRKMLTETRKVFPHSIQASTIESTIKITAEEIKAYFDANQSAFDKPARVQAQYVDFSAFTLSTTLPEVDDEELQVYWEELKENGEWNAQEKRSLRHILIRMGESKETAKKKAQGLLDKLRKDPTKFEEFAREFSEDPGSKNTGGLIENIIAGQMVEAFDTAMFSQNVGEIGELVETIYGFHIIRVEKIISPDSQTFAEVRKDLLAKYQKEEAGNLFEALAEEFIEIADEQKDAVDGMEELAKKYQLPVGQSSWISEQPEVNGISIIPFDDPYIRAAVLDSTNIEAKAIAVVKQLRKKRLMAIRVTKHEPRIKQEFETVMAEVKAVLTANRVNKELLAQANKKLLKLRDGTLAVDDLLWEKPKFLNRLESKDSATLVEIAFSQPSTPLPSYFINQTDDSQITIYRLATTAFDQELDKKFGSNLTAQFNQYLIEKHSRMIFLALADEFPVWVNSEVFEKILDTAAKKQLQ